VRDVCVVATDPRMQVAIDDAVKALTAAVLLAARLDADPRALRQAIDRAAPALATLKPKEDR
jgi:hypothetical protein